MTGGLAVKVLDYSVRGCGFESHQLLPRKGLSLEYLVSLPTEEGFNINIGIRLPPAATGEVY